MDKILSAKGQLSTEPILVFVPISDVIKEYDYGHFKLIRTKKNIVFHMAGMDMVIPPMMQTLYGQLDWLLDQKDKYDELSEEDKEIYDSVFSATMAILMNPTICFCDDAYWTDIAVYIVKKQNELFETLINQDLQPEDVEADAAFNEKVEFAEQLKEEAKEYAKEQGKEID